MRDEFENILRRDSEIAIEPDNNISFCRARPIRQGGRQPTFIHPAHQSATRIAQVFHRLPRPIRTIIIDNDDLEELIPENPCNPLNRLGHVLSLIVRWQDDGNSDARREGSRLMPNLFYQGSGQDRRSACWRSEHRMS